MVLYRKDFIINDKEKTNEEFLSEVHDLVGDEYTFLEKYIDGITKIKCIHNTCGKEWMVMPCNFLRGSRCFYCNGTPKKTNEEFIEQVRELVGEEYTVVGNYINKKKKCLYECRKRIQHSKGIGRVCIRKEP